jgi:hypothetical protein
MRLRRLAGGADNKLLRLAKFSAMSQVPGAHLPHVNLLVRHITYAITHL